MSESTTPQLSKMLEELNVFLSTSFYQSYLHTVALDISMEQNAILTDPPADEAAVRRNMKSHGKLELLESQKTFFEDARANLEKRIREKQDADMQSTTTLT